MDYTIDNQRELAHQWRCVTSSYIARDGDHLQLYIRPHPDELEYQANDDGYCNFELRTSELQSAIKEFSSIFGLNLDDRGQVEYNSPSMHVAIRRVFNVMIAVDQYIMRELGETPAAMQRTERETP